MSPTLGGGHGDIKPRGDFPQSEHAACPKPGVTRLQTVVGSDFRVPDRGSGNPTPLGGWDRGVSGVDWLDGSVQAWQPSGLALQVPRCPGDEAKLQRHLSWRHVRRRRTNPALSRNLKPPPLGGGVFTRTSAPNIPEEECRDCSVHDGGKLVAGRRRWYPQLYCDRGTFLPSSSILSNAWRAAKVQ